MALQEVVMGGRSAAGRIKMYSCGFVRSRIQGKMMMYDLFVCKLRVGIVAISVIAQHVQDIDWNRSLHRF